MAEISVPAWPIPIQNTKVVMYIAHITGVRLPAAPIPTQIWYDHARMPAVRTRPTMHIHPKYRLPGNVRVLMTSRLTSANVGPVAGADLSLIYPGARLGSGERSGTHSATLLSRLPTHRSSAGFAGAIPGGGSEGGRSPPLRMCHACSRSRITFFRYVI